MKPLLAIALVAATLTIGTAKPASATMAAPAIHYGGTDTGIAQQVGHPYYGNRHYSYGHGYRNYGYRNYGSGYGYRPYGYYRPYAYYRPYTYYRPYGYYQPYGYYGGYRPGLSLWFGF